MVADSPNVPPPSKPPPESEADFAQQFSARLRDARERKGLNKRQTACRIGVSPQRYQRYENGRVPKGALLPVIAAQLDVSLDWLFGRELRTVPITLSAGSTVVNPHPTPSKPLPEFTSMHGQRVNPAPPKSDADVLPLGMLEPMVECIAKHAPYSEACVRHLLRKSRSVDLTLEAMGYAQEHIVPAADALRAVRATTNLRGKAMIEQQIAQVNNRIDTHLRVHNRAIALEPVLRERRDWIPLLLTANCVLLAVLIVFLIAETVLTWGGV